MNKQIYKNTNKQLYVQKLKLAISILDLIEKMSQQNEDYSLLQRTYNSLIEDYNLDLKKIRWIDCSKFEFIEKNKSTKQDKSITLKNEELFNTIKNKSNYMFWHEKSEDCYKIWNELEAGERRVIARIEYNCIDIEFEINKESYDTDEEVFDTAFFVCIKTDGIWNSDDFAENGGIEYVKDLSSWDDLEKLMFNSMIDYCQSYNIDYNKDSFKHPYDL